MSKPIFELSMDVECSYSGLPEATCSHCLGHDESEIRVDDYEICGRPFDSQFHGVCTINPDHKIRRGTLVSKIQHAGNPFLPVPGVACGACTLDLPRATR